MLQLTSIALTQFKNYTQQNFVFDQPIVAITGSNGVGKTNLLDAIHYLSFTKSYFSAADGTNIQQGSAGFRIHGSVKSPAESTNITIILRENGKKEVTCNEVPYEKFSQHIGKYPCVMIAPDDVELITGGSELRRKFLDTLLCQLDPVYMQHLIDYNKLLQQRNSFLKQSAQSQSRNNALLDVYDQQLVESGSVIYRKRETFLPAYQDLVLKLYYTIAGKNEPVTLRYESQLYQQSFADLLLQARERDYQMQRSTTGIHKDNLDIRLNGDSFKSIASQGQRKSLLFSLKLAEAAALRDHNGFAPLLLLDDVFEKLDAERMHNLLQYVCIDHPFQVFITDTHRKRIEEIFGNLQLSIQMIEL